MPIQTYAMRAKKLEILPENPNQYRGRVHCNLLRCNVLQDVGVLC